MTAAYRQIHQPWSLLDICYRVTDALCIVTALWVALGYATRPSAESHAVAGSVAIVLYYLAAEMSGVYRNWRGAIAEREVSCALVTWGYAVTALLMVGFLTQYDVRLETPILMIWFAAAAVLLAASRVTIRWFQKLLRSQGLNTRGCAIVGVSPLGFQLARNIDQSVAMGLKLVGFYDDRDDDRTPEIPADVGSRVGNLDELVERARAGEISMIYITFPMRAEARIKGVLDRLSDSTASVYLVPDFFVYELLHSRWTNILGLPAVSVFEHPFYGVDGLVKRAVDLTLASVALALLAVPMSLIALLVKATSRGPVFFLQTRYGLDGREIKVWKYRSMRVCEDGGRVAQATQNDARVTPLGAVLRKTSLDELPQLFNVIEGTMSLVGPRPHATAHNEQYRRRISGYMLRHKVKPGITGLAQVSGWRGETDTLEKMEGRIACDHQYIRQWSLWLDLKILFRTIFVVLSRQNAY